MATPAAPPRTRRRIVLSAVALPVIASAAMSAGVVLLFFANLLIALGEPTGTRGNVRLLQFLSPADVAVGAILVLAVALVPRSEPPADDPLWSREPAAGLPEPADALLGPADVRLIAGFVAAMAAIAALVRAIVSLTISHQPAAIKLGNMVDGVASILVAAAAALWAFKPK